MKKQNHKADTVKILKGLVTDYPTQRLGLHISLATEGSNLDSISDKELYFLLEKYSCEKALDMAPQIIEDDMIDDFTYVLSDDDDV